MKYKKHSSEFKAMVSLEAIRGDKTLQELSDKYGIHPNQIVRWKKEAETNFKAIFEKNREMKKALEEKEKELERTQKKLGQTTVEVEWLKKKLGPYL
jgi:putative transposase